MMLIHYSSLQERHTAELHIHSGTCSILLWVARLKTNGYCHLFRPTHLCTLAPAPRHTQHHSTSTIPSHHNATFIYLSLGPYILFNFVVPST
jgi:hypothetical protein